MKRAAAWWFALWGLCCATRPAPCGEEQFVAHPNRSIQFSQIRPGNKLVFEYVCQTKGFSKTIAHRAGVRHAVAFEVDAESHAFYLQDQQLARAKVVLSRQCHCQLLAYDHLQGVIQGRVSAPGQWEITLGLSAIDAQGKERAKLNSTGTYRLP